MRRASRWSSIALILVALGLSASAAHAQTTALFMDSQPGDYIGKGVQHTYTPSDGAFTVSRNYNNGVSLTAIGPAYSFWWYFDFAASGKVPLGVGTYDSARRYPFAVGNGLSISGNGAGCNQLTGRFVVREIEYGPGDTVLRFSADFEQHCEDQDAGLFGAIRYNATSNDLVPFGGAYPVYQLAITPPDHGRVTATGLDCGGGGATCLLTLSGATQVAVTATPDPGYMFAGWSGDCEGASTAFVRINSAKRCSALFLTGFEGTTALFYDSQSGDYIGQGLSRIYTPVNGTFTVSRNYRQGVTVSFNGQDLTTWTLDLAAPDGQPLTVGSYTAARRYPFTTFNGLSFSGSGRGCNELTGRFIVKEIEVAPDGAVKRFAADFEQHCENMTPALFGGVRFHSSGGLVAFDGAYPVYQLDLVPPVHGQITGPQIACLPGATSCSLGLPSAAAVSLTATPAPGYLFAGWTEDCSGGAVTSVQVNGPKRCGAAFEPILPVARRTLLHWESDTGNFLGQGNSQVYSPVNSRWSASPLQNGNGVELRVEWVDPTSSDAWTLRFQAPQGEMLQAGRRYTGADDFSAPGVPVLVIFGDGRFCGGGIEFTVRELTFGPNYVPEAFAADFILTCGAPTGPKLIGSVQFNSRLDIPITTITVNPSTMRFAATRNSNGDTTRASSPQTVAVSVSRPEVGWAAISSQPWFQVSPSSGTGSGTLTVSVKSTVRLPAGSANASVTVTLTDGSEASQTVSLSLASYLDGTTAPPFGYVDTPFQDAAGVTGAIPVTGWALDDLEVAGVTICRDAVAGEIAPVDANCGGARQIFIGNAVFIEGARSDVQNGYPLYPHASAAGWGFMLLTNNLPNQGNGQFVLSAYVRDREGYATLLGIRRITCDNAHATTPFGAIDTPGQGETIAGTAYVNFGWALTQNPKAIPTDGSTMMVYVDGVAVGQPSYGHYRSDIAVTFPGLANSDGAVGFKIIDTTTLANGLHTIVWTATDTAGVTAGLGSRYFRVANGAALTAAPAPPPRAGATSPDAVPLDRSALPGRRTWDALAPWQAFETDVSGRALVRGEELDHIELALGAGGGGGYTGYSDVGGQLAPLPIGSRLDAATGMFTWAPGVGFVGTYDLVFMRTRDGQPVARREVRIVLEPKGSGHVGPLVVIDTPSPTAEVTQPFGVAGWAIDLDSGTGTGIDAVHVWAYPVAGGAPIFVGAASYGIARPDVAAVFGDRFAASGYGLTVDGLAPGTYDLAVFAWSEVTGDFVRARVVRVTAR